MARGVLIHSESVEQGDQLVSSRFLAGDAFVYIELGGRRLLAVGDFEVERARHESGADEVWGYRELESASCSPRGSEAMRSRSRSCCAPCAGQGSTGRRAGLVPARDRRAPARGRGEIEIDDDLFERRRRTKDAHAIAAIREVTVLVEQSMGLIRARLAACTGDPDGTLRDAGGVLTSERLQAAVRGFWAENGLEGTMPIIAGGPHCADPHDLGSGPLLAGTPIICDLFPRSARTRYHGDMTRTFCVGEPPAELVELHATVERALDRALAAIRPGIKGSALDAMTCELFEQAGYPTTAEPGGRRPQLRRPLHPRARPRGRARGARGAGARSRR